MCVYVVKMTVFVVYVLFITVMKLGGVLPQVISPDLTEQMKNPSIEAYCPEDETQTGNRILKWYPTLVGQTGLSNEICVNSDGWVTRWCGLVEGQAVWSSVWKECYDQYVTPNITDRLYSIYLEAYRKGKAVNVTDLIILLKRSDSFKFIDVFLLLKCLDNLPDKISIKKIVEVMSIISRVMEKRFFDQWYYQDMCSLFNSIFQKVLNTFSQVENNSTINFPNLFVTILRPFKDNITGIALYRNFQNNSFNLKKIHRNQSHDVDVLNLEMAAYVPFDFLENLIQKEEDKEKLYIIMFGVRNSLILEDYFNYFYNMGGVKKIIGINIPGFCKQNSYAILNAFFDSALEKSHWIEFGREYFDSLEYPEYKCILSKISYFALTDNGYFESAKKEYCMPNTTRSGSTALHWRQTPIRTRIYQKEFCADKDLKIPSLYCNEDGVLENDFGFEFQCSNHSTSTITQHLYDLVVECKGRLREVASLFDDVGITYVDVKLYFYLLICLIRSEEGGWEKTGYISSAIDKGFNLVENFPPRYQQIVYVTHFFTYFLYVQSSKLNDKLFFANENFAYLIYKPFVSNITGLVSYQSASSVPYDIKYLTADNATEEYSWQESVDIAIFLTEDSLKTLKKQLSNVEKQFFNITLAVIHRTKFVEINNYLCRSRILTISYDSLRDDVDVKFFVYFKYTGRGNSWKISRKDRGLSGIIQADSKVLKVIFISEPNNTVCDATGRITAFFVYKITNSLETYGLTQSGESVDIISKLWTFINPEAKTVYDKHYRVFRIFMITGSILSILGVSAIILTALLFKNWHKKRFYSMHLTIAIACQSIYFLRDSNNMKHVEYLIFYYCTLCQFSWMMFIGYVHYIKFIKIFQLTDIGTLKPTIIGWFLPAVITLIPILLYMECLDCSLCSKNGDIFIYFVITPIFLVIVFNVTIYTCVMVNISRNKCQEHGVNISKIRKRAAVLLPFLLGISWIFIFALIFPWSSVVLVGSYFFYTITPLNGFVLFIFVVLADESTRRAWKSYIIFKLKL